MAAGIEALSSPLQVRSCIVRQRSRELSAELLKSSPLSYQSEFQSEIQENATVYKIAHRDGMGKPEVADNLLKKLVGERGFEPPTPGPEPGG